MCPQDSFRHRAHPLLCCLLCAAAAAAAAAVQVGTRALKDNMTALGPRVLPLSEKLTFAGNMVTRQLRGGSSCGDGRRVCWMLVQLARRLGFRKATSISRLFTLIQWQCIAHADMYTLGCATCASSADS